MATPPVRFVSGKVKKTEPNVGLLCVTKIFVFGQRGIELGVFILTRCRPRE